MMELMSIGVEKGNLILQVSWVFFLVAAVVALVVLAVRAFFSTTNPDIEFDSAELGIGTSKITFRPNRRDQEIAYKIWVELSTRKIGLPIDLTNDVVIEVYESWYAFFSVTRELIKEIPVSKVTQKSTRELITLSVSLLNLGLRPHLTKWQARFRRWYEKRLADLATDDDPQKVQAEYPKFEELKEDLLLVNKRLMLYREKMHELVLGKPSPVGASSNNPSL